MSSTPKNDYYGYIKMRIKKYKFLKKENSIIAMLQWNAIDKELAALDNEKDRDKYKAVKMVLIDQTHTINGAALNLHYSYDTVKIWIQDFIKSVGHRSGF